MACASAAAGEGPAAAAATLAAFARSRAADPLCASPFALAAQAMGYPYRGEDGRHHRRRRVRGRENRGRVRRCARKRGCYTARPPSAGGCANRVGWAMVVDGWEVRAVRAVGANAGAAGQNWVEARLGGRGPRPPGRRLGQRVARGRRRRAARAQAARVAEHGAGGVAAPHRGRRRRAGGAAEGGARPRAATRAARRRLLVRVPVRCRRVWGSHGVGGLSAVAQAVEFGFKEVSLGGSRVRAAGGATPSAASLAPARPPSLPPAQSRRPRLMVAHRWVHGAAVGGGSWAYMGRARATRGAANWRPARRLGKCRSLQERCRACRARRARRGGALAGACSRPHPLGKAARAPPPQPLPAAVDDAPGELDGDASGEGAAGGGAGLV